MALFRNFGVNRAEGGQVTPKADKSRPRRTSHAQGGQVTPKADKSRPRRTSHAQGGQVTPKADKSAELLVRRTGVGLRAIY
jgi:hypothetical protein